MRRFCIYFILGGVSCLHGGGSHVEFCVNAIYSIHRLACIQIIVFSKKKLFRVSQKAQETQKVPLSFPSFPAPNLGTFLDRSVMYDIPAAKECRGHRFFFLLH